MRAYVPVGVVPTVETVRTDVSDPVRSESELGFKAVVTFAILGDSETFKLTLPAKLFRLVSDNVKVASEPWEVENEAGLAPRVKSGVFDCPAPTTWLMAAEAPNPDAIPRRSTRRIDQSGRGLSSLFRIRSFPLLGAARIRNGLVKASTMGQRAKGLLIIFRIRTSLSLRAL